MPPDYNNRPIFPFFRWRSIPPASTPAPPPASTPAPPPASTPAPPPASTPAPPPAALDKFLGSSFRDRCIRDENGEGIDSSDETISTEDKLTDTTPPSSEPSEPFDAEHNTGVLTYPSGRARWLYPFDFQDKRSRYSHVERLLSLLVDWTMG